MKEPFSTVISKIGCAPITESDDTPKESHDRFNGHPRLRAESLSAASSDAGEDGPKPTSTTEILTMADSTSLPTPPTRPLRVFAFDPSRGRLLGNEMQLDIRYRLLAPGPVDLSGARDQIAVIDYDATRKKYYQPVDLNDPLVLIPNGLTPSECDPRFHQQMVYAVAC